MARLRKKGSTETGTDKSRWLALKSSSFKIHTVLATLNYILFLSYSLFRRLNVSSRVNVSPEQQPRSRSSVLKMNLRRPSFLPLRIYF